MFFQWYKYSVINIKTFYQSFPFLCSMFTLFRLKRWNSPEHSVCSVDLIWLWRTNLFNIKCPWVRKKHTILPCKTASGTITECFSLSVSIHILVFFSTDTQKNDYFPGSLAFRPHFCSPDNHIFTSISSAFPCVFLLWGPKKRRLTWKTDVSSAKTVCRAT